MNRRKTIFTMIVVASTLTSFAMIPTASAFSDPYAIYGSVTDDTGLPLSGVEVTVVNTRTGESWSGMTASNGRYSIELKNLPGGYNDGDTLKVSATHQKISATVTSVVEKITSDGKKNAGSKVDLNLQEQGAVTPTLQDTFLIAIILIAIVVVVLMLFVKKKKNNKDWQY